ncbi:hypothetical protein PV08_06150 [Exophiala spinifera]|uniref:Carbonic anhydrase n=1 Tax=Exophiala spinifera TaxID=91928 RepID=A0A0D2BXU8_9EURO|nr:uncharacterized protein PV08_06150 [Exophiala spinifera]KIW16099.1 hypothetical protein PV08_06150 [Exophiala spinifera]
MATVRSKIERLLEKNVEYSRTYPGTFTLKQLQAAPGPKVMLLTCLDPRCVPENFFGPGLFASSFRNAGGRVTEDAIRSITGLRALVGMKGVAVVHHTDCGVSHITAEEVREFIKPGGPGAAVEVENIDYQFFTEEGFEEALKEDVRKLRALKSLAGMEIYGFAMDTQTGLVREVTV